MILQEIYPFILCSECISKFIKHILDFRSPGGGNNYLGDVNVSTILDSFSVSYDKRVRPNYGGK